MRHNKKKKWEKVNILKSQVEEIKEILKDGEFANVSQFVVFVIRKELEFRRQTQSKINMSISEEEIKEKLESWIKEINQKIELDKKLKKAFENSKSHTKILSMLT